MRLDVLSALVATDDLAGLSRDARSPEWPPARKRWTRPFEIELMVYPVGQRIVELATDEALDPQLAGSLSVDRVLLRSKGLHTQAQFRIQVNRTTRPPVHLSFDVTLRIAGQTIPCGQFLTVLGPATGITTSGRESPVDVPLIDANVRNAEIVLSPNPQWVEQYAQVDRIWGREVVFRDVPLRRLDLGEPTP